MTVGGVRLGIPPGRAAAEGTALAVTGPARAIAWVRKAGRLV